MYNQKAAMVPLYIPWTNDEKTLFIDLLRKNGKNWRLISESFPTRTKSACKHFGYDLLNKGLIDGVFGKAKTESFFKVKQHSGLNRN